MRHATGHVDSRSKRLKGVVVFLAVLISGMFFVYFYHQSSTYFYTAPFTRFIIGDNGAKDKTEAIKHGQLLLQTQETIAEFPAVLPPKTLQGCQFPDLDPFDSAIQFTVVKYPPLDCSRGVPNLVYLDRDTLKINSSKIPNVLFKYNDSFKECKYKVHAKKPGSDFVIIIKSTSSPFTRSIKINATDEHFFTECYSDTGRVLSRSYFTVVRPKPKVEEQLTKYYDKHIRLNNPKETLSVLLLGIDGMSRQTFIRSMPKTRGFLVDVLKATEMQKYNKIGLNTYPNVMGLLTGKHVKYHPFGQWSWTRSHFDSINKFFIWSDYRRAGYRTAMMLDTSKVTAFHCQKKGWNKEPVDYYLRPMPVAYGDDTLMKHNGQHCVGDIPAISLYHDFWVQLTSTFNNTPSKPYFGYSFAVHLTHDDHNKACKGDHLYHKFLKELYDENVLNNTVIIWFSDHGERFGKIRTTYNGILEARMPFLFLVFPPWFREKYPQLMETLKINQQRLTSHFDVYETLRDLLYFKAETGQGDINKRGISLFKEIPIERTCHHIDITPEFCVCNSITEANVSFNVSQELGLSLAMKIINSTSGVRDKCIELKLKSVISVLKVASDTYIRTERKGSGLLYQLSIVTEPGGAIYEGILHCAKKTGKISVIGQVSRLNLYQGQAECIGDPILRPFCFCKK